MAARQASQSNAMLYALITFVGLFIIATVCAVIFYVKSEEFRTQAENAQADYAKVANRSEQGKLAKIVGKPEQGKTYLGTMQSVSDSLYSFILGQEPSEEIPAVVKFNEVSMKTKETLEALGEDVNPAFGPNGVALLKTIDELKLKLENARSENGNLSGIIDNLQTDAEDTKAQAAQERQQYLTELDQFQQQVDEIRNGFDTLRQQWDDSKAQEIAQLQNKIEETETMLRQKQMTLQETEKKLGDTDNELKDALAKLDVLRPDPNREVQAYEPDANIVNVDLKNGIVYLDAGVKDRVYRGLTFAIYDRNKPIPEDGQGKAEIEVFQVEEYVSAARIVKSDKKNPIVSEDIVSNLIWDRKGTNYFVVAGGFDFNNDGYIEADGAKRIQEMIERWGGTMMNEVTVDTDFIVIGTEPDVLPRPTQDELDIDPMAQQRYDASVEKMQAYNNLLQKANNLGVPVFNQKRFMYLIGYDTLANKNPLL